MHPLAKLDHRYVWHPFTQMREWLEREPIVLVKGQGAELQDARGRRYLDANSSIWTNLHGHNHPRINAAIRRQLSNLAHSSALGFANEPASLLARQLVEAANPAELFARGKKAAPLAVPAGPPPQPGRKATSRQQGLAKVFFSDDGSTALEVALKLAYEFSRRTGMSSAPRFLSLEGAYHGDTVGAVSLGHIPLFHQAYGNLLFKTDPVMSPYCYRCRFNRAKPERVDAREHRKCHWECLGKVEDRFKAQAKRGNPYVAFVFEPLMQGAAGMIPQPAGWLAAAAEIARGYRALLIADEVMTGFGRTGTRGMPEFAGGKHVARSTPGPRKGGAVAGPPSLFACHREKVQPDFLAFAKGLTGGYVPMAATLTTQRVFDAFLGEYSDFKTFFHGHSFTGNQIGASAALASLKILSEAQSVRARFRLQRALTDELRKLWKHPQVGDIRQAGLVAGIELVKDWRTREPIDVRARAGIRVCERMARRGVLTRPVGNVIVLMPPYCTTDEQVHAMVSALDGALAEVF